MARITIYLPVGDGTRDRGEETRILDYDKKTAKIKKGFKTVKEIDTSDIISVDAWRVDANGQNTARDAVSGGILFGAAGALIGAATADKYIWFAEIITQTEKLTFRLYQESDKKGLLKWWEKLQNKR